MGAKNSTKSSATYLKLKAKTSDSDPTPYFGRNEKKDGEWTITDHYNSVDGTLIDISHETYEYEHEEKNKVQMVLQDKDGSLTIVEGNFSNLMYGILNSLAGCEKPGFIDINVWLGAQKEGSEKRYPSAAMTNDGEKAGWKYEYASLPKPNKVTVGKKTVTDDSEVIEFWRGVIDNEIKPKLPQTAAPATEHSEAADVAAHDEPRPAASNAPTDDLPF